jgi:hypothetical protein
MVDWIYSSPIWLWGTILVVLVTGISLLTLVFAHRVTNVEMRRRHNDVTAAAMGIVGVAYAVLIAFVAVAAWDTFSTGDRIVDAESSFAGNLYRDTIGLSAEKADPIKADVKKYIDLVITEEWPTQQRGEVPGQARATMLHIHALVAGINPQSQGEAVITAELLKTLNELYSSRRTRLLAADAGIPGILWWIIAFGTFMTIGFTFLFGTHDFRMHLAITGMVAASMSLVVVLIIALDRPFRGDLSISSEPFENVRDAIKAAEKI